MDPTGSSPSIENPLLTSMKTFGQNVISLAKPVCEKGNKVLTDACGGLFDTKECPSNATADQKTAFRVRQAFAILAKLTLVAAGISVLAVSVTVLKTVIIAALIILGLSYISKNEKIINAISQKINEIIALIKKASAQREAQVEKPGIAESTANVQASAGNAAPRTENVDVKVQQVQQQANLVQTNVSSTSEASSADATKNV